MRREVTGVVLAGGRGTRMGGLDKGLVLLHGRPLAAHAIDRLRPQVDELLISANRNQDRYAALGAPVITDASASFDGPLAGMLAALSRCETPWLVTVPCDLLHAPPNLVSELLRWARALRTRAAYALFDDDPLYVCTLLHRDLTDSLASALTQGERWVARWLETESACGVPFALPFGALANLNTLEDVAAC